MALVTLASGRRVTAGREAADESDLLMITEDQTAVIEFLASPATHGGGQVERVDTRSAIVVLVGAQ